MSPILSESEIESLAISWFTSLGYKYIHGSEIAPKESHAERENYFIKVLPQRLHHALAKLNPSIPKDTLEDAYKKITIPDSPSFIQNNRSFHRMLVDGVIVEYRAEDRSVIGDRVQIVDWKNPEQNDWLIVNQFSVAEDAINEDQRARRFDIVLFLNGLPIGLFELKNPGRQENATIESAFNQLETYKHEIPSFFTFNEFLVISDGMNARIGTISSSYEWFMRWRQSSANEKKIQIELETIVKEICEKRTLLDLIRFFIVYEEDVKGIITKKMAGYHQFHAVQKAIETTITASRENGDRKCGVVWHTQGSGKSLTMVFYAGQIIRHPEMKNPTIVVVTDRNDLDNQLFDTFSRCHEILRQQPVQVTTREDLKKQLSLASGGVVFTTIQKFFPDSESSQFPELSDRSNIIVIADEAHRSQYGFAAKFRKDRGDISYGYAKYLRDAFPNASFIGFTGTPIETNDRSTRDVFGKDIDVYDIQRAIDDKATVPIYYDNRSVNLQLNEEERPHIDDDFDEITEDEEEIVQENLKTKWTAFEKVVGSDKRLSLIANDIVNHFEQRQNVIEGKAIIVCMSRRICVTLYNKIIALRPEWHDNSDSKGIIKIIMTGSASDHIDWQPHIRNKSDRDFLANRYKNNEDPFKIAIVRDMWLTGFDVPCLQTMYIDKRMRGHTLMQAIARVNRVFHDKPAGLIVDFIGLAQFLQEALRDYIASSTTKKDPIELKEKAVKLFKESYQVCCDLLYGINWSDWRSGEPQNRLEILRVAIEFLLNDEKKKEKFLETTTQLVKAFDIIVPHEEAIKVRDDIAFFRAIKAQLQKFEIGKGKSRGELDYAINQLVSKAISTEEEIDIFQLAGLDRPGIPVLSDEFLEEINSYPHKNIAVEILLKLLNDDIKSRSKKYLIQSKKFSDLLENTVRKYQNQRIENKVIIKELIDLAKEMREAYKRGENLQLSEAELAFYDALEVNDSAVENLGDEILKQIARDLVKTVKQNITIDWSVRESVRAKMRIMIKRTLRKYGYPPDKQEKATQTVMEQAELICRDIMS